jgi:aminopeptidase C
MTQWIKERAEGIRQAEKERKTERERLMVIAADLKAKTEPFWKDLVNVLEESVRQFNIEFPDAERRIDQIEKNSPTALTIKRTAYPAATVKVGFNQTGTSIPYAISTTVRKGANVAESQANLTVGLVNGEAGYIEEKIHTHEDAAKLFLDPFFGF